MFQYFYHERIRKSVAIFGALFNNIHVIRTDSSGKTISQIKVPLSYAPREKYLDRIRENPNLSGDTKVAIKLPRMSFEIIGINYNPERKIPKLNSYSAIANNSNKNRFYTPAPYDLQFQLNVYARQQDDALQVVEQILPYFNPQYNLTINPFSALAPELKEDIPITIQGVNFTDDFEGALEQRRTIIYALDFTMQVNFYGPISNSGIIKKATIDTFELDRATLSTDVKYEQSVIMPDPYNLSLDSAEKVFNFTGDIFTDFTPDPDKNPSRYIPQPTLYDSADYDLMRFYGLDSGLADSSTIT
jgi:hypothetical protein